MNENEVYSIKDILTLLWNHAILIIVFSLLAATAGYSISKYYLPLKYASHITIYVQSYTDIKESAESIYNVNNINYSKQLVNTYIEVLKDDAVMDEVGIQLVDHFDKNTLAGDFAFTSEKVISPASIRNCLAISTAPDTSAIKVTATTNNAETAAFICNVLTEIAPKFMQEAVGVGSINTIGKAKTNRSPVSPNNRKNTLIGGAAGFMLIVALLFLIDFLDNTIKDADSLKSKFKKPIIGEIEQFGETVSKKKMLSEELDHFKLTDKEMPFDIVESFKSIRTNVSFTLSTNKRKILAVSSANLGDGKSTIAANIAIAIAQSGSKVLLIDADMRKSVQHTIFGLKNKCGLSTAVSQMDPLDQCIQKNVMDNLDIMPAGPTPPNPSELLASEEMTDLLNELSSRYSIIIIDTPPVNIVTDAMELAKNDAGLIMVVRYGYTTEEDLKTAGKKIEFAQMNLLGFILNGIKPKQNIGYHSNSIYKRKYYYNKHSGFSYGYYGKKPEMDLKQPAKKAK